MGGVLEVTSRELKIFQGGLRIFGESENISSVWVEVFSCWLRLFWVLKLLQGMIFFLQIEIFLGGGRLIFFQRLKVFSGD